MSGANVAALDKALADGAITETEYAERFPMADEADTENAVQAHAAQAQAEARSAGVVPKGKSAPKATGHANDGTVVLHADGTGSFDLAAIKMLKGSTGKVSGYCRILVNGKAIGALTLFSPADMADADKAQSTEATKLRDLSVSRLRAGDAEGAVKYLADADAAQKRYDEARNAAKQTWEGKTALDVVRHREAYQ